MLLTVKLLQIFGIGILVTILLTFLTPWAAKAGIKVLILVRIIEGIFEVSKRSPPIKFMYTVLHAKVKLNS